MTISSAGGLILVRLLTWRLFCDKKLTLILLTLQDSAVAKFKGIAVFQPVFNGVGGNLVAIQASRISTHLHTNVDNFLNYTIISL